MKGLLITWLLIQAAIANAIHQAIDGSVSTWGEWTPCRVNDRYPNGRRLRLRLCQESDVNCLKNKMGQIAKCPRKDKPNDKDFTKWSMNNKKIERTKEYGEIDRYRVKHTHDDINGIECNKSITILDNTSKDTGTTGLTILIFPTLLIMVLHALHVNNRTSNDSCLTNSGSTSTEEQDESPSWASQVHVDNPRHIILQPFVGPPPKEGRDITAPLVDQVHADEIDQALNKCEMFSGTPAREGTSMDALFDNVGQDGNKMDGNSAFKTGQYYKTPSIVIIQNDAVVSTHETGSSSLEGPPIFDGETSVAHKMETNKSNHEVKGQVAKNECVDTTFLNQPECSRRPKVPSKRSRFAFLKRSNRSEEDVDSSKKEKKSRSLFSFFKRKKKQQNDETKNSNRTPSVDVSHGHVEAASGSHSLKRGSMERLKWQSKRRSSSLHDLDLGVKMRYSKCL